MSSRAEPEAGFRVACPEVEVRAEHAARLALARRTGPRPHERPRVRARDETTLHLAMTRRTP